MSAYTPVQLSVSTKAQNGGATAPAAPELGITPPVTPTTGDESPTETGATLPRVVGDARTRDQAASVSDSLQFSDQLEYQLDQEGRRIEFGRGAWSVVHKALSSPRVDNVIRPFTPPSSPTPASRLVAVKSPARRDARAVLQAEALTLSRASSVPGYESHVVRFHGYIADSNSLVMSAVPLSLSTYIEDKARLAEKNMTTRNMREPIQGIPQWHALAEKLVTGLLWLHSDAQTVHGDIKPHNILLKPRMSIDEDDTSSDFPYEPLFADFSSSHPITTSEKSPGAASTALTPPFTAPELLSSLLSAPDTPPTPASDVFSLAVTLLSAATGDLLLYPSQRCLLMTRDGHQVINFVQLGQNGTRIPKGGTVENILKPAVAKNPVERIKPKDWLRLVQTTV